MKVWNSMKVFEIYLKNKRKTEIICKILKNKKKKEYFKKKLKDHCFMYIIFVLILMIKYNWS